jgi:tetratricopeptide (TPR) repeat protein
MVAALKIENPTSEGGIEQLFEGDFKHLRRELDQKLWPAWIREDVSAFGEEGQILPGASLPEAVLRPQWVTVEVENGYLRVDRTKFTPEQEAYYQASQYMSREEWSNAAEAFHKVLELNPNPILRQGVTIMAGTAYFHMGDLDRAARMFEEAVWLNEHNDFAHLFLGTARMLAGRFDAAVAPLRRALELNPHSSHVLFYLGHVYEELGQSDDAIASYNAEIEDHREATEAYERLAKLYKKLGDENPDEKAEYYLKAIETYKKWARVEPSNSAVRNLVGYLYTQVGNLAGATEAFAKAVEARPDNLIALSNWGIAYLNAERSSDAREVFERLASFGEERIRELLSQTSPDDLDETVRLTMAETYQLLGAANLKLHQSQTQAGGAEAADHLLLLEAEAAFKTALGYNPVDVHSLHNLGLVCYLLRRQAAAAGFFRRVLELDPEFPDAADILRTVEGELEQWRRWMEVTVGRFAESSSPENPVDAEDMVEKLAECRAKLYEGVDPAHEDDAFTPEHLLNAMLPVAEWLSKIGADDIRFEFAARIFGRGWLSSGKAARLAGLDRVTFLTNLHRVGIAVLDLDEEELENQASYVNAQ